MARRPRPRRRVAIRWRWLVWWRWAPWSQRHRCGRYRLLRRKPLTMLPVGAPVAAGPSVKRAVARVVRLPIPMAKTVSPAPAAEAAAGVSAELQVLAAQAAMVVIQTVQAGLAA